eukprot:gene58480-80073_t
MEMLEIFNDREKLCYEKAWRQYCRHLVYDLAMNLSSLAANLRGDRAASPEVIADVAAVRPSTAGSWLDFLRGLVPGNVLGLTASTGITDGAAKTTLSFNVLQLIVVAIAIGVAAVRIGEAGAPFLALNASLLALFRRILRWVVRLTPIGTAALLGHAIVHYGWASLSTLGAFTGAIYLGLGLVLFIVYPAPRGPATGEQQRRIDDRQHQPEPEIDRAG